MAVLAVDDATSVAGARRIITARTDMLVVEPGASGTLRTVGSAELALEWSPAEAAQAAVGLRLEARLV